MENAELLPCPFCGGPAALLDYEAKYGGLHYASRCPQCTSCGCSMGYLPTAKKAATAWNRRSPPPPQEAVIPTEGAGLLPCPFCGAAPYERPQRDGRDHQVWCEGCETVGPQVRGETEAIAAWNHRAKPSTREAEAPVSEAVVVRVPASAGNGMIQAINAWMDDPSIDGDALYSLILSHFAEPYSTKPSTREASAAAVIAFRYDKREPDLLSWNKLAVGEHRLYTHPAPSTASAWKPIETAPKDGTLILTWCVHVNAEFCDDAVAEGYAAPVIAKWIDHNGGGFTWHGLAGTHTHWMPLPTPPATEGAGDE